MNRYPQISKRLGRSIDEIKAAVKARIVCIRIRASRSAATKPTPITPDAVIYYDEDTDKYEIKMTNDPAPNLYISGMYRKMLKDRSVDKKTREFLANNVRNARWLIESIEQRRGTIHRVIRAVVDAQRDFFDKGPESSQAAADDPGRRPARHSRRHRLPRRQRKMDPNPARHFPLDDSSPAAPPAPKAKT